MLITIRSVCTQSGFSSFLPKMIRAFLLLLAGSGVLSKMVMLEGKGKAMMSNRLIGDGDVARASRDTSQHLDANFRPIRPRFIFIHSNQPPPTFGLCEIEIRHFVRFGKQQSLPDGIRPPTDVPEGFDLSTVGRTG